MPSGDVPAIQAAVHRHWLVFLVEGVVLLLLGAVSIIVPEVTTLAVTIFVGWLLLISGIVGLISTLRMRQAPGFIWSLVSAILGIAAGAILALWPTGGSLSLTFVLIVFFWIEGVVSILFALDHRRQLSGRWGWMMVSGVIDLILGVIILSGLPGSAAWAVGLLLGVNLVFGGAALISMALAARQSA